MKKIEIQVKDLRLIHGYTLEEVASMLGKSPSTVSRLENSLSKIDLEVIRKLCELYNADLLCWVIPNGESILVPDEFKEKIIAKICSCHGCDKNRK